MLSQIVVYNLNENRSYRVEHNFFHSQGGIQEDYDVDGLKFSWDDAIFSIALGAREKNSSFRLAYFHPMSRSDIWYSKRANCWSLIPIVDPFTLSIVHRHINERKCLINFILSSFVFSLKLFGVCCVNESLKRWKTGNEILSWWWHKGECRELFFYCWQVLKFLFNKLQADWKSWK